MTLRSAAMDTSGAEEQSDAPRVVEVGPVRCSCEWSTVDTGSMFYSRIVTPDPDCPVHRR
jgi:hypothetical protein